MSKENPLKDSIDKRLEEERYRFPKGRKEKQHFNIQLLVLLTVIISLVAIIIRLVQFFMG